MVKSRTTKVKKHRTAKQMIYPDDEIHILAGITQAVEVDPPILHGEPSMPTVSRHGHAHQTLLRKIHIDLLKPILALHLLEDTGHLGPN